MPITSKIAVLLALAAGLAACQNTRGGSQDMDATGQAVENVGEENAEAQQ
jgi:predicted small secreted protein